MKPSFIKFVTAALIIGIFLTSCEKKELPVKEHEKGDVVTASINMQEDYRMQVFYDLETNSIVSQNLKTSWDLAFETSETGFHVLLNSSKVMFAYNTGKKDFESVTTADTAGRQKWDTPDGNLNTTAIGNWQEEKNVYIIDRGISSTGSRLGLWKIQFDRVTTQQYELKIAPLNTTEVYPVIIMKDSAYNFSFLSMEEQKQVFVEPPKNTWDIAFTQYTHIFEEPFMPYLVTGCLLNRYNTSAIMDSTKTFSMIEFSHIPEYTFSTNINTIGYDWKAYTGNTYVTYSHMNYIIRNRNGVYYKLHFIDFLAAGVKGNPKWEFQSL